MTQGKYGLNLTAIAILGFVLAFFGLLEALILFLAYALILEKDQWLTRQVFQAFYLTLAYKVALTVVGWFFTAINAFFGLFDAYKVINFFTSVHSVIRFLLNIGLFVLALIAVLRLAKSKDANLPVLAGLTDKTMGLIKPKAKPQPQPAPAAYTAPPPPPPAAPAAPPQAAYQPPTPPPPPAAPEAPPVVSEPQPEEASHPEEQPVEEAAPPAPAADKNSWFCTQCGKENQGNFCIGCGAPKPKA